MIQKGQEKEHSRERGKENKIIIAREEKRLWMSGFVGGDKKKPVIGRTGHHRRCDLAPACVSLGRRRRALRAGAPMWIRTCSCIFEPGKILRFTISNKELGGVRAAM